MKAFKDLYSSTGMTAGDIKRPMNLYVPFLRT